MPSFCLSDRKPLSAIQILGMAFVRLEPDIRTPAACTGTWRDGGGGGTRHHNAFVKRIVMREPGVESGSEKGERGSERSWDRR